MTDHALMLASTLGLRPPGNADLPFMSRQRRNPPGARIGARRLSPALSRRCGPQGSFSRRRRSSNAPPLPGGLGHASGPQGYRGNSSLHSRPVHGFGLLDLVEAAARPAGRRPPSVPPPRTFRPRQRSVIRPLLRPNIRLVLNRSRFPSTVVYASENARISQGSQVNRMR
jgi:hypothetical protein